ncbi:uncharacterized protein LOC133352920 [Lethenteron reissneri]|uniref:uncharacterized protein LOC133352920 n=1 Tax=Lethenteron reissneri TaxID=7753 RepID=UPI002AB6AB89|nr:uncharacterized protein LOC133352920 [Lethenteron reissneri]
MACSPANRIGPSARRFERREFDRRQNLRRWMSERFQLSDLQRDAARGGAAFQSLRSSLSESEAASERLLGTLAGTGAGEPAARACRDAVDGLLGRWADATQRLAARLGDALALEGGLRAYWDGRDWLRAFLADAGARQDALDLRGEDRDATREGAVSTLHVQKTLLVELEENEHKLSECGERAKQCAAHMKAYDIAVKSYRTAVEVRVGAPAKGQDMASSGDVLTAEVQELNSGYAELMGRARSNLEALESHLLHLETCEKDSASVSLANGDADDPDRRRKEEISFQGLRGGAVTLWQLERAGAVDPDTSLQLVRGSLSVEDVSGAFELLPGRAPQRRRTARGGHGPEGVPVRGLPPRPAQACRRPGAARGPGRDGSPRRPGRRQAASPWRRP